MAVRTYGARAERPSDRSRSRRLRKRHRCLLGARTLPHVAPPPGWSGVLTRSRYPWPGTEARRVVLADSPMTQGRQDAKGAPVPDISVDAREHTGSRPAYVNRPLTCANASIRRSNAVVTRQDPTKKVRDTPTSGLTGSAGGRDKCEHPADRVEATLWRPAAQRSRESLRNHDRRPGKITRRPLGRRARNAGSGHPGRWCWRPHHGCRRSWRLCLSCLWSRRRGLRRNRARGSPEDLRHPHGALRVDGDPHPDLGVGAVQDVGSVLGRRHEGGEDHPGRSALADVLAKARPAADHPAEIRRVIQRAARGHPARLPARGGGQVGAHRERRQATRRAGVVRQADEARARACLRARHEQEQRGHRKHEAEGGKGISRDRASATKRGGHEHGQKTSEYSRRPPERPLPCRNIG